MSAALRYPYPVEPHGKEQYPATTSYKTYSDESPRSEQAFSRNVRWIDDVAGRILSLCSLGAGWDGHTARPVDRGNLPYVIMLLKYLVELRAPKPSVVPLASGGLQLEWHRRGWDTEIEIHKPGEATVWARDVDRLAENEILLGADLRPLEEFINHIRD